MKRIVSGITLALILATLALGFQCQKVQAYVSTPVESGQLYENLYGILCACYGYVTTYDYAEGTVNNPYFFPAIEVHADPFFVYDVKTTVSGTRPDGSAISGLEFTDLGYLASPHDTGSEYYYAFTVILNILKKMDPTGASQLLVFGQPTGAGTNYDSNSAWAEWKEPPATLNHDVGLQFRFALHCDPNLYGTYTLNLNYYVEIWGLIPGHGRYVAKQANFYQTITYTKKSNPPNTPSTPSGPTSGYRYTTYTYSTSTTDPDGDNILYEFDWGDGTTSQTGYVPSGTVGSASHSWASPGTYLIKARAQDSHGSWSVWSVGSQVSIANRAPSTPSTPSGPTSGYRNVWYTYSTCTTDPDVDNVHYEFEFSGPIPTISFTTGWYTSGATGSLTVKWDTTDPPGTYYVRVRAQDTCGAWSGWSSSLTVNIYNRAPNTPSTPSGPSSGYVGHSYAYSTSTTDSDGDNICYQFDWGDGATTTTSWYASGTTAYASHTWGSTGTYYVKVRAQDVYGAWSGWSPSLTVSISTGGGGGGGCPTLFSWSGTKYEEESLLDIHAMEDVTLDYTLNHLKPAGKLCMLSLRELDTFTSHIDCVKLFAVDTQGNWHECELILAKHSQLGPVTSKLASDDGTRVDLAPQQTTDLLFTLPKSVRNIQYFVFELNGYNMKLLV